MHGSKGKMIHPFFALLSLCALGSANLETIQWFGSFKGTTAKEGTFKAHSDQAQDAFKTETAAWRHDELNDLLI
jgi:hypothetical protein